MIIKLKDEINSALDFNQSATALFDKINQIDDSDFIMDFELSEDGNYVLFVRKADGCASRIEVVLPDGVPQTRRLKLNDERHKWDVPALEKDSNPPFVLKKGKCRIVIRKSRRSSKVPAVTGAYLCRDWHTVLPLLRELDNLLKMYGK